MTNVVSSWHRDYHTEAADTVITDLVPPLEGCIARINSLTYRLAGTAHTLKVLRAIGKTATSAAAAAAQKVMVLSSGTPGKDSSGVAEALAASDYLVWKDTNGVYQFDLIASVATVTSITMTANIPTIIDSGAPVWALYEVGRADHFTLTPAVSTTNTWSDAAAGIAQGGISKQLDRHNIRDGKGDPILLHSTNATAAGFLEAMSGTYVQE